MSYSIVITGKDKEKLKAAVRAAQVKDEVASPHSGVPGWVADHLCNEIDRVRIYTWQDRVYGVEVNASGSFHEQGMNHSLTIRAVQLVE